MSGEPRSRGWGAALALALFAILASAIHPALLIAVPLGLLMVALPPVRSPHRLIGVVLLGLLFATPRTDTLWYAERGWALVLGACFLAAMVLWPRARFIAKGMVSLGAAALIAGLTLSLGGGWQRIEWSVSQRFHEAATFWTARLGARAEADASELAATFSRVADIEVMIYPAMLALASLAALAVSGWIYGRWVERGPATLGPLREFRFADHLVWLLIAAAVLLIVPLGDVATRMGVNLATFMGALYALRGAAVVLALTAPGGVALVAALVLGVLMLPFFAGAALVVGVTDTWLDLRARVRAGGDTG